MHTLNPQQELAVNHVEGPLLVIAGAGSGKTRVVTFRIAHLLELGVPASEIIALTFTNKAAGEMRERVEKLAHQSVLTCTFHSLCARILRESIARFDYGRDFVIFDEEDSEKVLKECLAALNQTPEKGAVKALLAQISRAKNALLTPENLKDEDPFFLSIYKLYQAKLKEYNALDFDDLLFLTAKLFQQFPEELEKYQTRWSFILIDEYQDTNHAQYQLIKLLAGKKQNVFAVGDPDQSIYSWRGASIDNILNFERDFPGAKVITLEQNYRSRSNILEAANALISHNKGRYEKNLWSERKEGEKIALYIAPNDHDETDFVVRHIRKHHNTGISLSECVIFYRTHFQSRIFEDALLKQRLPYVIVGGLSFYQRREIKDILAILRLIVGGGDWLSFARTINIPKRGLGESTLTKLRLFAQEMGQDIFSTCTLIVENKLEFKLTPRQAQGLKSYVEMILALKQLAKAKAALHEIVSSAIELSCYVDYLKEDPDTYEERRENIEELKSKAAEWQEETTHPSLPLFLEELSLKSSHDEAKAPGDAVRMMTLHNSKGLEFDVVFIVGMEEELLPHMNSYDSPEALEEERRLAYVGMTRAKEFLYLTASYVRFLWGVRRSMQPSRFLREIPETFLQSHSPSPEFEQAEQEERPFAPGQLVFHRDLGRGVVETSYQTSYGLTYEVFFPEAGISRTLVAKFAKLTALNT